MQSSQKRTWSFDWPTSRTPAQSQSEASDEERLMILRMLEQKKISLAEAAAIIGSPGRRRRLRSQYDH